MSGDDGAEIGRHPAYVWTMVPLVVIAVVLNIMVIAAVTKYGRFKSSVDFFLTNLAVSEILQSSVVFPIHLLKSSNYGQDFYGGSGVCKLTMFTPLLVVMAAILSMVIMAIDRYRNIIHRATMGRKTAMTLIGCIWLVSCVVSSPQLYEYNIYDKVLEDRNTTMKSCGSENIPEMFETVYASLVFSIAYCGALLLLVICYVRILLFVWKNSNSFIRKRNNRVCPESVPGRVETAISTRRMKVLKLLISLTLSFTILWTPYFILFALTEIMHLDDSSQFLQWPHVIGRILSALSALVNPIIFILFSDKFRTLLSKMLKCQNVYCPSITGSRQEIFSVHGRRTEYNTETVLESVL